ncbi:hypothetical protein ACHFJ0_04865 [Paracoccus sp. NGMCC 1.201697]|uniref:Uncharacterized protein n=1 Tax=Paracoccus broussonetiae subsp. drimophilus TaxID=3373869 RepID=A0ABW7LKW9_9RHOB
MLIVDIFAVAAVAGAAFGFDRYLRMRIQRRRVHNRLLAVASEDFHEAASSMMRTPADIPDEVLKTLSMMSETGFGKDSEKNFLEALRAARRKGSVKRAEQSDLSKSLDGMRDELKALFLKAGTSWFNIMTHKSGRYHRMIRLEAMMADADRIETPQQAISTAAGMRTAHC